MAIIYYIIDLETSGLKPDFHEVNEISIIRCSDKNQLNKFIKSEYPERAAPKALEVTGRTMSDLLKGDSKEEVVASCNNFFEKDGADPESRCIVGHNIVGFDKKFIHALWKSVGSTFPANLWLDTMTFMTEYSKLKGLDKKRYSLTDAMVELGLKPKMSGLHTAKVDSQNNYYLLEGLRKTGVQQLPLIKRYAHTLNDEENSQEY